MIKAINFKPRLSLRSLLVLCGLFCVLLLPFSIQRSQFKKEERAIKLLENNYHATVINIDDPMQKVPEWDYTRITKRKIYRSADSVFIAEEKIDKECISLLNSINGLKDLQLQDLTLEVDAFSDIHSLPQLQNLIIDNCTLPKNIHEVLSKMKHLRELHLIDCDISDTQLIDLLSNLQNLEEIYLAGNSFTEIGLASLAGCKKTITLGLEIPLNIEKSIHALVDSDIETIYLGYMPINEQIILSLSKFSSLKNIYFKHVQFTPEAKKSLNKLRGNFEIIPKAKS